LETTILSTPTKDAILKKSTESINKIKFIGVSSDVIINIEEFSKRPKSVKGLNKRTYKYLDISPEDDDLEFSSAVISFTLNRALLDSDGVSVDSVVLNHYKNNEWIEIKTNFINVIDGVAYFEAITDGFSYFAISLKQIVQPTDVILSGPKESHIVSGTVFEAVNNIPVESKTKVILSNEDNQKKIETQTGIANNSGAFYTIIEGNNGDEVNIEVSAGLKGGNKTIILEDGINLEEAKIIAQNALINKNFVRIYDLSNPLIKNKISDLPNHQNYWFIFFLERQPSSIEYIFMAIINKKTGEVKFSDDYAKGHEWILEAALLR